MRVVDRMMIVAGDETGERREGVKTGTKGRCVDSTPLLACSRSYACGFGVLCATQLKLSHLVATGVLLLFIATSGPLLLRLLLQPYIHLFPLRLYTHLPLHLLPSIIVVLLPPSLLLPVVVRIPPILVPAGVPSRPRYSHERPTPRARTRAGRDTGGCVRRPPQRELD
ncbi:hypothetical protein B0H14DRAFT_1428911 [Mycena olivaceomarginata]|nr:hypothetical protein B0H14DRAFT_1428911 [Mycena olivaceomarginata]